MIELQSFTEIGVPWPIILDAVLFLMIYHSKYNSQLNFVTKNDLESRIEQHEQANEKLLETIKDDMTTIKKDIKSITTHLLKSKNR